MAASIFGILLAIAVGFASAQQQCTVPQVIDSNDGIANYSISGLQMSQTFYFNYDSNGIPTTLALMVCSQYNCNSQCAVTTTAKNKKGASTCYGKCTDTAYIFGQNNYEGLVLSYTAGSNSAKVTLRCNLHLDPSKVVINQVTLNGATLNVTGETYCSSTPKQYTEKRTYYGTGWPCANQNYQGGSGSYTDYCKDGCVGNYAGSTSIDCDAHW